MPSRVVLCTRRAALLAPLLEGLAPRPVTVTAIRSRCDWTGHGAAPPALWVVDWITIGKEERARWGSARTAGGCTPRTPVLAIVRGGQRTLRQVLPWADGILLDPFDLGQVKTELRRSLSAPDLSSALEAMPRFLRGAAHEILNPLASISGLTQILLADDGASPQAARLRAILAEADRIQKVISRIEQFVGSPRPQRRLLDLDETARALETELDLTPAGSPIRGPAWTLADPDLLHQALRDLVGFLRDSSRDSRVEIELLRGSDEHELCLTGQHPAPLPDPPADVLLPYHERGGPPPVGGLELSACHGILVRHGASLEVEPAPGGARCVRIRFPRARELPAEDSR